MTQDIEKQEDPIILYIMNAVERGSPINPRDIAIEIADDRAKENSPRDAWRKYLMAVKQQAKHLARLHRISILRHGVPIDPNKMKGLVKLSLPVSLPVSLPIYEGSQSDHHEDEEE